MAASLLDQAALRMLQMKIPQDDLIGIPADVLLHAFMAETTLAEGSVFEFPIHHAVKRTRKTLSDHSSKEFTEKYTKLLQMFQLPEPFNEIYRRTPDDESEVSWRDWVFFSTNKMLSMAEGNVQKHYIDVASTYIGMGWVRVLSWDKTANVFFLRTDGGENCYTREDHWLYFNKEADKPKGFNIYESLHKCFNFRDFLLMDPSLYEEKTHHLKRIDEKEEGV